MSSGVRQLGPARGLLCLLLLTSAGWSESSEPSQQQAALDDSAIVATVGEALITAASLRREMQRAGGHDPSRFDELEEKQAALETVIRIEVLARAAMLAGYDKDPGIQDEFKRLLAQRFWADQQREKEPLRVTDEEVQSYYEEHQVEFEQPIQVRGSIALLRSRVDASPEDRSVLRQKAEDLADDVHRGRLTFADAARRYSEDSWSRKRGGDIGWVTPGQRVYRWDKQVLLTLGKIMTFEDVPRIVETDRGIWLVQLTGHRGGNAKPLEQVRRQIEAAIIAEKQQAVTESDYWKLRERYPVQIFEERLESVAPEVSTGASDGPPTFPVGHRPITPSSQTQGESGESL